MLAGCQPSISQIKKKKRRLGGDSIGKGVEEGEAEEEEEERGGAAHTVASMTGIHQWRWVVGYGSTSTSRDQV